MSVFYKGYKVQHFKRQIIAWAWFGKKVVKGQVRTAVGTSYKELKKCIDTREVIWDGVKRKSNKRFKKNV